MDLQAQGVEVERVSPWLYRAYQTEAGLPDLSITAVTQTQEGYLWVATKSGLLNFNGEKFTSPPPANPPGLPSRAVRVMFRDRHDQLWLAMERGPLLCVKADGVRRFTAEEGFAKQRVTAITEDGAGAIWVVYPRELRRFFNDQVQTIYLPPSWSDPADLLVTTDRQGKFWCVIGGRLVEWRADHWRPAMQLEKRITAISAGSESNLWYSVGASVFAYREGSQPTEVAQLPTNAVCRFLLEDRAGALWAGTSADGLFRLVDGQMEKVPTANQEITWVYEDQEENIWVGTEGGGLNLIRPRIASLAGNEAGLPFQSVQSVTEDAAGWWWAVSQDGQLARAKDGRWERLSDSTNWPGGLATCVAADPTNGVWVGTSNRGLKFFKNGAWRSWFQSDGLVNDNIRSLLVAANGDVWVASDAPNRLQRLRAGQVSVLTNDTRLGAIRSLAQTTDGTIWIGTSEGQVQRVQGSALVAEPAIVESQPLSVRSLLATKDGRLWIGYAGDGLGHLQAGKYQRLTTADGLTDDFVSQLSEDDEGNLWMTGNRGLARVSLASLDAFLSGQSKSVEARAYGSVDGLPGMQPNRNNYPSTWRSQAGQLLFSMHSGLLVVAPANVQENSMPPPVQLERVSVDDQLVAADNFGVPSATQARTNLLNLRHLTAPLQLGPGHRKLEIDFAGLSFSSPENVQFRYRLVGFDSKWVETSKLRRATYPRLAAGDYKFQVIACNNSGVWNEIGATLNLNVSPFFWERLWFRASVGVTTALLIAGLVWWISRRRYREKLRRLEARRALEQERTRIARNIHDDLGATLTRISLLSHPSRGGAANPLAAGLSLAQIHQAARDLTHAMGEVVWAVNPEHDTFDSLANYLSHYAQNFLRMADIRCRIEMPHQLPKQPLSAEVRHTLFLAFKEALNNVLKHADATEVRIALTASEAGFDLLVADNGKGFSREMVAAQTAGARAPRPTPGNGLANMHGRLQEIGGVCELASAPGAGTRITFRVKLKTHHAQP